MKRILFFMAVIFSTALYAQNTINDVLDNTVEPCTVTYGSIVNVSTVQELKDAINLANSSGGNMTVLIADGNYHIATESWYPYITGSHIVFRSASGSRDAVILTGSGMDYGSGTENVFYLAGDDIVIADMTIRECGNHAIATHCDSHLIYNVRIQDTYEQMVKGTAEGDGSDNCTVQCCLFEYTAGIGPQYYIGGIDVHMGEGWIVKDNVFRHIKSPSGSSAEHAVHFWNNCADNTVERNLIIDCDRGIGFGLGTSPNTGGIIRNNMIYNDGSGSFDDVGIGLETSPDTRVYNNTVYIDYMNSIEYRFSSTTNVDIKNNLANRPVTARDGATGTVSYNETGAQGSWFADVTAGDLSLASPVPSVVDSGLDIPAYVTDDIYMTLRPEGDFYDIGAHEYIFGQAVTAVLSINYPGISGIWHWAYDPGKPQNIEAKGSQWNRLLSSVSSGGMSAGDITNDGNTDLVVDIEGYGLWLYSFQGQNWVYLGGSSSCFTLARANLKMPLQVTASFEGNGLYILNYNTMTWTQIISAPADIIASGNLDGSGADELVLSFTGIEGLYTYSFADETFNRIMTVSPSQLLAGDITGDSEDNIVCVFDGYGIYLLQNPEGLGWEYSRLTWGTPDAGHQVSGGNISEAGGTEIIFAFSGRTYYYSHDIKGWSSLVMAPLKSILSGKFTGHSLDDLIVCDSLTNNIILYKTGSSEYEVLVFAGDAEAMACIEPSDN